MAFGINKAKKAALCLPLPLNEFDSVCFYFFFIRFRPHPASPISPSPNKSMVDGSGACRPLILSCLGCQWRLIYPKFLPINPSFFLSSYLVIIASTFFIISSKAIR
jgi:hypothetical protein